VTLLDSKTPTTPTPSGRPAARRRPRLGNLAWPLLALLTILLLNLFLNPGFFRFHVRDGHLYGSIVDILNRGAPVMLLSLGMTLVIATGGVDLSVGAVMALAGAVSAVLIAEHHVHPIVAIAAGLGVSVVAGAWNGVLVAYLRLQPIVATLILMVAGRGIAMLITDGQHVRVSDPTFLAIGRGWFAGLPLSVTIVAGTLLVLSLATRRTAIGLFVESVGNNPTAARYAGVEERMVKVLVYAFSGLCAGIAGLIAASNLGEADAGAVGQYSELDAILAVVVGGTALAGGRFSLVGSIIGALVMQTLTTTILQSNVRPATTMVVKAVVVIAVCLLQSEAFRNKIIRIVPRRRPA
jgi:simple sugar transport system permease protein